MAWGTIILCESNGAGETVTHGVANCVYGSSDAADLTASSATITAGQNSYEKFWRVEYDAEGDSTQIEDMKMWRVGSLGTGTTHDVDFNTTYSTPSTSAMTGSSFPTSEPAAANIEVSGVAGDPLDTAGDHSDYIKSQIKTGGSDSGATTFYIVIAWFES